MLRFLGALVLILLCLPLLALGDGFAGVLADKYGVLGFSGLKSAFWIAAGYLVGMRGFYFYEPSMLLDVVTAASFCIALLFLVWVVGRWGFLEALRNVVVGLSLAAVFEGIGALTLFPLVPLWSGYAETLVLPDARRAVFGIVFLSCGAAFLYLLSRLPKAQ